MENEKEKRNAERKKAQKKAQKQRIKVTFHIHTYFLHTSQVALEAEASPGFCNVNRQGVFLLPPGWDASPSQGYPQH